MELNNSDLMDTRGAATFLGCSEWLVRAFVRQGSLACVRYGEGIKARMRFRPQDLSDFAARSRVNAGARAAAA